ncbi:MAG: hypothetical protein U9N50_02020 [Pseudomonadota bacterium]|nr:hypothetical protein [Pseudomonadota bacterium]
MMGSEGGSPMQMCKEMTSSIKKTTSLTAFATPELYSLFSDWLEGKKKEVLYTFTKSGKYELAGIAKALKLTPESTAYLLARMAAEEKLTLEVKSTGSVSKPAAKKKAKKKKAASKKRTK